jgi:predicted component of type VI protein secretion system
VLAATTRTASSAIFGASNQHTRREPIVNELENVLADELNGVQIQESDEEAQVYAWRVERLSCVGLSDIVASAVAPFVDWHEIARLVERGCSPELALEIVR